MINTSMRAYEYFKYGDTNAHGQQTLIKGENGEPLVQGTVKLAIALTTQATQDSINYHNAQFCAQTLDNDIDDTYVIQYGKTRLKVLFVASGGRYKQVFLNEC
jgi:hypothetical protein